MNMNYEQRVDFSTSTLVNNYEIAFLKFNNYNLEDVEFKGPFEKNIKTPNYELQVRENKCSLIPLTVDAVEEVSNLESKLTSLN